MNKGVHGENPHNEKEDEMIVFLKKLLSMPGDSGGGRMVQAACKALHWFWWHWPATLALGRPRRKGKTRRRR